jgi:serine/threonine protein kinase
MLRGKWEVIQLRGGLERIELSVPSGGGVNLPYVLVYFPLERAKADLEAIIYSGSQLKILRLLLLFRAAVRSVRRLHANKICHRDLKPSNLLVFRTDLIKVADLGSAREIGEGAKGILDKYDFCRGDIRYTAPELICVARECDQGFLDGDFYSLGAILFEMVTSKIFGDFVYTFEYLRRLGNIFRMMPALSREDMFRNLLPSIISSHPMPKLSDITKRTPASISTRLDNLYKKLVEPNSEKRLNNFEELFTELEIMIRILRYEEKSKSTF